MRENILWTISVLAFVMSVATWLTTIIHRRRNLSVNIDFSARWNSFFVSETGTIVVCAFYFLNKSEKPLVISDVVAVCSNGVVSQCEMKKSYVTHRFQKLRDTNLKYYENFVETPDFPININGISGRYEFIHLTFSGINKFNVTKIEIHTNRGKVHIKDEIIISKFNKLLQGAFAKKEMADDASINEV